MKYCFFSAHSLNRFSADQCYFHLHLNFPQPIFSSQKLCVFLESLWNKMQLCCFVFFVLSRGQLYGKVAVFLACCSLASPRLASPHLASPLLASPLLALLLLASLFIFFLFSSWLVSTWLVLFITFQAVTCEQLSISSSVEENENEFPRWDHYCLAPQENNAIWSDSHIFTCRAKPAKEFNC